MQPGNREIGGTIHHGPVEAGSLGVKGKVKATETHTCSKKASRSASWHEPGLLDGHDVLNNNGQRHCLAHGLPQAIGKRKGRLDSRMATADETPKPPHVWKLERQHGGV